MIRIIDCCTVLSPLISNKHAHPSWCVQPRVVHVSPPQQLQQLPAPPTRWFLLKELLPVNQTQLRLRDTFLTSSVRARFHSLTSFLTTLSFYFVYILNPWGLLEADECWSSTELRSSTLSISSSSVLSLQHRAELLLLFTNSGLLLGEHRRER